MANIIVLITILLVCCNADTEVNWDENTCTLIIPESTQKESLFTFTGAPDDTIGFTIKSQNVSNRFAVATDGVLSSTIELDFESIEKAYSLQITATNSDTDANKDITCEIQVTDVNDEKPQFIQKSYSVNIPNNVANGDSLLNVTATDKDVTAEFNTVGYKIKAGNDTVNFTIDSGTGNIKAAHNITGTHTFKITVIATDSNEADFTDDSSVSVCIGCASGSSALGKSMFVTMSLVFASLVM